MPYKQGGKYYGAAGKQITQQQYTRRKRALTTAKYVYKGAQLAYRVARLVNVEQKHHDVSFNSTVSSTGTITDLSSIPIGDSREQRHGDSVKPLYLHIRGTVTDNASSAVTGLRLIVFRGKHTKSNPAVTDYLESADVRS